MIYARVHDRTVAADYYAAMEEVEKRLELTVAEAKSASQPVNNDERAQLLALTARLAEPALSLEVRLELVEQMHRVLSQESLEQHEG